MSRVFHTLVKARNRLYETGLLGIHRLNHPVISVGNLTTGGTGKTPLVIALATEFRDIGYRPVVLSRGYRRTSRGIVVVSRGKGPLVEWEKAGDEPFLMAVRLPGVAIVVGSDRHKAGLHAEAERLGNLFILDDGFQHRRLHRDVDIVAIDAEEWTRGEHLLPRGRWREPKSALERAHAACVLGSGNSAIPLLPIPSFAVNMEVDGLIRNGTPTPLEAIYGRPIAAFAGIAKPERFFNTLRSMGLELARTENFPDHHSYRDRDLKLPDDHVHITTEKDAVRLPAGDFYFLRISANIPRFNELRDLVLKRIV
jgi:tetraacyldisaccharide 4'-kinase